MFKQFFKFLSFLKSYCYVQGSITVTANVESMYSIGIMLSVKSAAGGTQIWTPVKFSSRMTEAFDKG